jgi:nucleoside-diphosphate-sugar epimerase
MMKILVTGGARCIGSTLVPLLLFSRKSSASVGYPRTWGQESGHGIVRDNAVEDFDGSEYRN